jgi:hypothetical protein
MARLPLSGDRIEHAAAESSVGMSENAERPVREAAVEGRASAAPPPDGFGDRLVKYIPAEVLAFFIAAAAEWGGNTAFLIVTISVAAVFTPIVLYATSPAGVRWYAILLAVVAFLAWAIGTSPNTDRLVGLTGTQGPFVLTVAAFVVPAVDQALGKALRGDP